MEANVQIAWQINLTVVVVVVGWVCSAILGIIFLMRQSIVIQDTNKKVDDLRKEREARAEDLAQEDAQLQTQITAQNAAFGLFKEKVLTDYPTRQELHDQRAELYGFLGEFKREVVGSIDRLSSRVDSLLQQNNAS